MRILVLAAALSLPLFAEVKITQETNRVDVAIDGKPFTSLFYGPETFKPFLHPLRAASGTQVSRSFPMETVAGETKDHPHHQGLWFTHGDVNGLDFWLTNAPAAKQGKVAVTKVTSAKSGKQGTVSFDADWVDPSGKVLLKERRTMVFSGDDQNRVIDFDITLTATDQPVKFGDTKEGSFAIRISDFLNERSKNGMMTNAAGAQGEKLVWGKPSPWVDYAGKIKDEAVGIAILDHPSNPKHPTYWHSRGYGLFAANMFGERDFFSDKTRDGGVTIEPGKSMRVRYRVVIHPGDAQSAGIAKQFEAYQKVK